MISYILAIITGLGLLAADQISKAYIAANFELGGEAHDFINGVIDLVYIHNEGGAWGMLNGYTWLLLSITAIIMLICVALLLKVGTKNKLMFWAICLVLCGGIGNMIDRIFRDGKVVDFLHFSFLPNFPIFNIADVGIVIGAGMLVLYFVIEMILDTKVKKSLAEINVSDEED